MTTLLERDRQVAPVTAPPVAGGTPSPRPSRRRGAAAWLRGHRVALLWCLGVVAVAGLLHGAGFERFPGMNDDEGTYVAQAWAVQERGELAHYTYWYDHPPFGWLQIAAWTAGTQAFDRTVSAVAAGRELMLLVHMVSVALLFALGRRIGLPHWAAALAGALFSASPLALELQRAVYLDNLAIMWVLAAFVLAASPRHSLWSHAAAGAAMAAAVLSKETTLLLLPAVTWQLLHGSDRRTRAFTTTAFASAFLLIGGLYPLYAVLKGELLPGPDRVSLLEAVRFQLFGRPGNGSVLDPASGAVALVRRWLELDRWMLPAAAAVLPAALALPVLRRVRPVAAALAVLVLSLFRPGYLPQMYLVALLPFGALVLAAVLAAVVEGAVGGRTRVRRWVAALALAATVGAAVPALAVWADLLAARLPFDNTSHVVAARDHVLAEVPRDARVLVDDTLWVDLVRGGFAPEDVIWFYKLDFVNNLDPSVTRRLPNGWRDLDYVVSTPVLRTSLDAVGEDALVDVRAALANSEVVASYGTAPEQVEIRRIIPAASG